MGDELDVLAEGVAGLGSKKVAELILLYRKRRNKQLSCRTCGFVLLKTRKKGGEFVVVIDSPQRPSLRFFPCGVHSRWWCVCARFHFVFLLK